MKACYDGLAKDEQDIPHQTDMIKAAYKGEQGFYSAYVDDNEKFDKRTSDRREYKTL